jgi:hypothetical protein
MGATDFRQVQLTIPRITARNFDGMRFFSGRGKFPRHFKPQEKWSGTV